MIGQTVAGKYKVVSEIGEGATGSVFRAEAEGGQAVAIKILRKEVGGGATRAEVERRFEREALAAAHAQHPNCVTVRDFGALEDGRPYLVMDLVEGRSLARLIEDEKMIPIKRALHILAHILRGLEHAHRAGVVHRDLKPGDIALVERDGDKDWAIILDFGTAALIGAAASSQEPLTRAGTAIGTPLYMAPERLGAGVVDGRADLYSATCILFEMLTGKPPFEGDEPVDVLKKHASAPIPSLAEAAPELVSNPGLDAVLMRGLAKIPANRFKDATEYLTAVEALIEGRLDAGSLGKSTPAPGTLAAPDANKATTVFHGAPDAIRAAAAAWAPTAPPLPGAPAAEPVASVAGAPRALPPLPAPQAHEVASDWSAPAAVSNNSFPNEALPASAAASPVAAVVPPHDHGAMQPLAGAGGGKMPQRKLLMMVGGGAAALLIIILIASRSCGGDKKDDGTSVASLEDGWRKAGLDPGGFAKIDGQALGNGTCKSGAVNGLDVTVCSYPAAEQAAQARKAGLASVGGSVTGSAVVVGNRMLVVVDRKNADPSGRSFDKVVKVFQGKPLERPVPPGAKPAK